ncbi:MAG: SET domain-containing protein [Bacteroidetes bacterium]|nr:SET domain-containing protein [Bacteroidota bacterium]
MIHPHTELRFISPQIGHGVFATRFIPKGTVVWTLCVLDRTFTPDQVLDLPEILQKQISTYAYINSEGNYVLCWDFGRYLNHSCNPAMMSLTHETEIAIRDIHPGEELTCDYSTCNIAFDLNCRCGSPDCRGTVRGSDIFTHAAEWKNLVQSALESAKSIEQPLFSVMRDQKYFFEILNGEKLPPDMESFYVIPPEIKSESSSGLWALPERKKTGT